MNRPGVQINVNGNDVFYYFMQVAQRVNITEVFRENRDMIAEETVDQSTDKNNT